MFKYILDANFFIQSHRINYPIDIASSFWKKVKELAEKEIIISIDKVKEEIFVNKDNLRYWVENNLKKDFFKTTQTENILDNYKKIINRVTQNSNRYTQKAIDHFLSQNNADAFLIAFVLQDILKYKIVTYEVSNPHQKSKIKIPDVCNFFNIKCINTNAMFRELKEAF